MKGLAAVAAKAGVCVVYGLIADGAITAIFEILVKFISHVVIS